jgi:hypothetical protein
MKAWPELAYTVIQWPLPDWPQLSREPEGSGEPIRLAPWSANETEPEQS